MTPPAAINPRIVEALYAEALALSDEVRGAFTLPGRLGRDNADKDPERVALSSEGLRTTTRMMHGMAWVLNRRAYFMGEISEMQLHRHGRLSPQMRRSEPREAALLKPEVRHLVARTQRFYDRLLRLDGSWRLAGPAPASAVNSICESIEQRLTG